MSPRVITILALLFYVLSFTAEAMAYDPRFDQSASPYALAVAKRVAKVLCNGWCNIDLFQNTKLSDAAYTIVLPNGAAKVIYNPVHMNTIENKFGEGASFGILAHEVGHVIDLRQSVGWMSNSWNKELRADAWSGCAIARANLSEVQTISALQASAQYPSPTHPAWNLRVPAFEAGYHGCGGGGALPSISP